MPQNSEMGNKGVSVVGRQTLFVPGPILGLNEMLLARGRGHYSYNSKKQQLEERIYYLCWEQKVARFDRAWFWFEWLEPNRRRDKDNVAAGKKFILDGLVKAWRLPGDGWKHVIGWRETFAVDRDNPGVRVHIFRDEPIG